MKTFVIAEIGINHAGSLDTALQMVRAAKQCGVSAVKFQTYKTELLAIDEKDKENFQRYELTEDEFKTIKQYCDAIKIEFFSTPFDVESAHFLNEIGVRRFKISSGNITNKVLLQEIAKFKKPVLLSTGMSTLKEKEEAYRILNQKIKREDIVLMHCRSIYPTSLEQINLGNMLKLKKFHSPIGLSDHSTQIDIPSIAVIMGATYIEKHFTLDRHQDGADHRISLDVPGFNIMMKNIRNIEIATSCGENILKEERALRKKWLQIAGRKQ